MLREAAAAVLDAPAAQPPARPAEAPPPVTLRAFALAALAERAGPRAGQAEEGELAFLHAHLRAVAPGGGGWVAALHGYLRRPAPADLPLVRLAAALDLEMVEALAVALAAAVEDDALAGRALAHLQRPLGGSRPTLSLLATCLAPAAESGMRPIDVLASGSAARAGVLQVLDAGAPLPERAVAVPLHLCQALAGGDGHVPGVSIGVDEPVPLPPTLTDQAARHADGLRAAPGRALVIRSGAVAETRAAAAAVAAALECRAAFVEGEPAPGLGPWLLLRGLVPVFRLELAPGERRALPAIPGYSGPVLALCGPDGSVEAGGAVPLSWTLSVPPPDERRRLWQAALGQAALGQTEPRSAGSAEAEPGQAELADTLATRHRHASGRIAHLGRLARHVGAVHGRTAPVLEDVVAASRSGGGTGLEALAQPLPAAVPDEALVTGPELREELERLLLRCLVRDGLADGLGISTSVRYTPGVRALFVGPSGTGKTLAAGWIATRLGLPLYRVDLASVTSKYIGETEKNLALLLARAEASEVVLLFDEADSMFGKRTEVREANDRFANAQTNYLLQRIESYDGICILTSNSRSRFDPAFARRLDVIVDFPLPGPQERRALWEAHLGADHAIATADLNRLAAMADVGGGNIRNAVLEAAVRARHAARPIAVPDVEAALAGEYRKLGKTVPAGLRTLDTQEADGWRGY
ncbi:MAG TPA: ATP-binding protein [Longimicrobium sp.]|uniref:ATP-binding protein n=1 Tax=Longimicrobium sp. TaxID=2029185 RepID=UPI002ED7CCE0